MTSNHERMLAGEPYNGAAPELAAIRKRAELLTWEFNNSHPDEVDRRAEIRDELFGEIGENVTVMPPFRCDYGENISIGAGSFINYDGLMLDCGRITLGEGVLLGPRVQLITALHPMDDFEARREGVETTSPVTLGDNVWVGTGAIICPGVTVGENSIVGAGSVVTRDVPPGVFAAGNPCRVIRCLGPMDA